jgi:hypothetical protein
VTADLIVLVRAKTASPATRWRGRSSPVSGRRRHRPWLPRWAKTRRQATPGSCCEVVRCQRNLSGESGDITVSSIPPLGRRRCHHQGSGQSAEAGRLPRVGRSMKIRTAIFFSTLSLFDLLFAGSLQAQQSPGPAVRRVIVFVYDGLRADDVTPENMPNYFALARSGVIFADHHSAFRADFRHPSFLAFATKSVRRRHFVWLAFCSAAPPRRANLTAGTCPAPMCRYCHTAPTGP